MTSKKMPGDKGKNRLNYDEHKVVKQSMVAAAVAKQLQSGISLTTAVSAVVATGIIAELTPKQAHNLLWDSAVRVPDWCKDAYCEWLADRVLGIYADRPPRRSEIAAELGLNAGHLNRILQDARVKQRLQHRISEVTADPMIPHVREMVVTELLPIAYETMKDELQNGPWGVRQNARRDVMKLAGVTPEDPIKNDAAEAAQFLQQQNILITVVGSTQHVQMTLPPEYQKAMENLLPPPSEVVDGSFKVKPVIEQDAEVIGD